MRFVRSSSIALFSVLCVSSVVFANQYLLIEEQLAKVYKDLDPKAPIIKQVKKGEYLDLIYDGTSWHKVLVETPEGVQEGWIERRAGKIVDRAGNVPVFQIILFLLVVGGTLGGVLYYIQKNRTPSMVEGDEF
ncbi:MAG: hypothetical protein JXA18_09880 [Chitinispirillaceae bacterium]|nr:hypothetical protein [Chitinispirillaceae bacterium]